MPRVLNYFPHYKPVRLDVDGLRFSYYGAAYQYCLEHHQHDDDHYGTLDEPDPLPDEDEFEPGGDVGDVPLEDWQEVARQVPDLHLLEEEACLAVGIST